jgi:hypothetical protein
VKQDYVTPELKDLGSVAELTLGGARGGHLDADFSAGTAYSDLTFS